jgi:hypothetical protein
MGHLVLRKRHHPDQCTRHHRDLYKLRRLAPYIFRPPDRHKLRHRDLYKLRRPGLRKLRRLDLYRGRRPDQRNKVRLDRRSQCSRRPKLALRRSASQR